MNAETDTPCLNFRQYNRIIKELEVKNKENEEFRFELETSKQELNDLKAKVNDILLIVEENNLLKIQLEERNNFIEHQKRLNSILKEQVKIFSNKELEDDNKSLQFNTSSITLEEFIDEKKSPKSPQSSTKSSNNEEPKEMIIENGSVLEKKIKSFKNSIKASNKKPSVKSNVKTLKPNKETKRWV